MSYRDEILSTGESCQCLLAKSFEDFRIFCKNMNFIAMNHVLHSNHTIILKRAHNLVIHIKGIELFLLTNLLSHSKNKNSSSIPVVGSSFPEI